MGKNKPMDYEENAKNGKNCAVKFLKKKSAQIWKIIKYVQNRQNDSVNFSAKSRKSA